jgi:PAS domain S-box-containing protein
MSSVAGDQSPANDAFSHAACGLLTLDTQGIVLRVNHTLCVWLGYPAEAIVGRPIQDFLTAGGRVFRQTHWAPLVQMQGSVAELKLQMLTQDGRRLPMLINTVRRTVDGMLCDEVAIMMVEDRHRYEQELLVTRKQAEAALAKFKEAEAARLLAEEKLVIANEKLLQADRAKDEFLATLAHELRSPLSPLRNATDVLKIAGANQPRIQWVANLFERQINHMAYLVEDLSEITRITQGKVRLRRQQVDLAETLQGVVDVTMPLAAASSLEFLVDFPVIPVVLSADPIRVAQIVQNLLNNAVKYTPSGGSIRLTVARDTTHAIIAVRDSGIGIPAEALSRVFAMFSQLEQALDSARGGLGIGLALVHGLVEAHGGTVQAFSSGMGQGSEFVVHLPLLQA